MSKYNTRLPGKTSFSRGVVKGLGCPAHMCVALIARSMIPGDLSTNCNIGSMMNFTQIHQWVLDLIRFLGCPAKGDGII